MNYFRATVLGVACILLISIETGKPQSTVKSTASDPIRLAVTVTDEDQRSVTGLPQTAFTFSDDAGFRTILSFSNEDVPLSMVILFDLSGSVSGPRSQKNNKIKLIAEATSKLIEKSNPSNEYFIIAFARTTYVLADGTGDMNTLLSALQKLALADAHGNTALYDACSFAIDRVKHGTYPKKVILLISDGMDNESRNKLEDLRSLLKQENILIYALNTLMRKGSSDLFSEEQIGARVLEELTSQSGGTMHSPSNVAEIKTSLERIALELRQQYSVSIDSAEDVSGSKWHPLRVTVTSPSNGGGGRKLTGRSKRGYYSKLK